MLAGPILRRVESNLATVWLALSQPAEVTLSVWEGIVVAGFASPFATSKVKSTLRLGDKLHLVVVTVDLENTGKTFQAGSLYSYDVALKVGDKTHTLASLHMLRDATAEESPDGIAHAALGYASDVLPSFAPCPQKLTDLRILYGSCRKPNHRTPDAMVWIDDYVRTRVDKGAERPHHLILGGDQVYADDVSTLPMLGLMDLAAELIGVVNPNDPKGRTTVEKVQVDRVVKRNRAPDAITLANAHEAYGEKGEAATNRLPIDKTNFPPGQRLELTKRSAQFTSSDGTNHVISFGEFAALYLMAWSNACWPDEIPGATLSDAPTELAPQPPRAPLKWSSKPKIGQTIELPKPSFPEVVPEHLYPKPRETPEEESAAKKAKREEGLQRGLRKSHQVHAEFRAGLPRVRRALANIPTYMMFDDHEITDDWFLSPTWRDRVLATALGTTILNNGTLAYALFQDWGNDPQRYESGTRKELLEKAVQLFPPGASDGPVKETFERLSVLFGHNLRNEADSFSNGFKAVNPPIHWNFRLDAPAHRLIAFDNRTRRSYPSKLGPPGNIAVEAMPDQIPAPPLSAGQEVLIVIAPLQVVGPPVIDDIVAPASFRIFDMVGAIEGEDSDLSEKSQTGLRQMLGTNPDAIETWALDAPTFEALLKQLEPYKRVVILSGDVHNSTSTAMSYWKGASTKPTRIVQFTSSGLKNVMPSMISAVDRAAAFAQQMIRLNLGSERLGWDTPQEDLVRLPPGMTIADLVPRMRARLKQTPVLLPTWGWPENEAKAQSRLNPAKLPDWRWRAKPLLDTRANLERPASIQELELDHAQILQQLKQPETVLNAYQAVAARHQHALGRLRQARQILFYGNFGVCRFNALASGAIEAVHELHTAFVAPDSPAATVAVPEAYMVHRASLGPLEEEPPTKLRVLALEAPAKVPGGPNG